MSSKRKDTIYNHSRQILREIYNHLNKLNELNQDFGDYKDDNENWNTINLIIEYYCYGHIKRDNFNKQDIKNFITINRDIIEGYINEARLKYERELEERKKEREREYLRNVNEVKHEILSKIHNKIKLSRKQVGNLKICKEIKDEDIDNIYEEYSNKWEECHPDQDTLKKIAKRDTFDDKLKKYVIENMDDNLLNIEDFGQLIRGWNRGRKSINECYEKYKKLYFNQPTTTIQIKESKNTGLIGYKSPDKIKVLKGLFPGKNAVDNTVKASFDLKSNIKRYQLHKCASRNTWIIDLMFCEKLCYLVAINVNTKYLYVELMNDRIDEDKFSKKATKSTVTYLRALDKMIRKGMKVKHLIGDGEKAFNSSYARTTFYKSNGIDFKPVPRQVMGVYPDFMKKEQKSVKTDPLHSSLGIVDRVIRTIRDIAYNMKIGVITPEIMDINVKQYNNAPHRGLSKWAGFSVTPKMVNDDPDLETYIVRRICQENFNVMNRPGFKIKTGTNVKVYNEKDSMSKRRSIIQPGSFKVNGFKNGLYEVEGNVNGKNKIQKIPRYKLEFIP